MAKVLVLAGYGINCEIETAHACRKTGFSTVDIVHQADILSGDVDPENYDFFICPGGFMDGDDLGAGKAAAGRFLLRKLPGKNAALGDILVKMIKRGGLVLGICNGFQLLSKLGLLPLYDMELKQRFSVSRNDSGKFEDRWVNLVADEQSPCVFTAGLSTIELPVRHGEGKIIPESDSLVNKLVEDHLIPLRYADTTGTPTMEYPGNPNGSVESAAGICDLTGRVFGLMPHPEAYHRKENHPLYTMGGHTPGLTGLVFFDNAKKALD